MDLWILSFMESVKAFIHTEISSYRLYTVVPRLVQFIDNLTNWYVRMNRKRIKGEQGMDDCLASLSTLSNVLYDMTRLMAPYTPFLTELMFQNLKLLTNEHQNIKSIHFLMMPEYRKQLISDVTERAVAKMQKIIECVRIVRDNNVIPIKYPLQEVIVVLNGETNVNEVKPFERYLLEELNVKNLILTSDIEKYGVILKAEPDHKVLGARFKGEYKTIITSIKEMSHEEILLLQNEKTVTLFGQHKLTENDVRIKFDFAGPKSAEIIAKYHNNQSGDVLVLVDTARDESGDAEGLAREIINRIQKLRKKAGLVPTDKVEIWYSVKNADVGCIIPSIPENFKDFIQATIKTPFDKLSNIQDVQNILMQEIFQIKEIKSQKSASLELTITNMGNKKPVNTAESKILTVQLCPPLVPGMGIFTRNGLIFQKKLECLDLQKLKNEISHLFELDNQNFDITSIDGRQLNSLNDIKNHQTICCKSKVMNIIKG